jgi:hypothetical protein
MRMSGTRLITACVVTSLGLSACALEPGSAPTRPTPSPGTFVPTVPTPVVSNLLDWTLSGRVYEVVGDARQTVGIEGVQVYCEQCGESTHTFAGTDANGEYVFPRGFWDEGKPLFPARISVRKTGYQDPPGTPSTTPPNPSGPGWREVVLKGDTRFDMELVRR